MHRPPEVRPNAGHHPGQDGATVSEASRQFDLSPSEVEGWVDEGQRGMENALQAKPELTGPIKALIEEEPSFGYRAVTGLLGMNKNTA